MCRTADDIEDKFAEQKRDWAPSLRERWEER